MHYTELSLPPPPTHTLIPFKIIETDLRKNGSKMAVTQDNKNEYIKLLLEWRLTKGVKSQMEALVAGLTELVPLHHLSKFDAQELEWLIAGTPEINVEDWRINTEYTGGNGLVQEEEGGGEGVAFYAQEVMGAH